MFIEWMCDKLKLIFACFICITAALVVFLAGVSLYEYWELWLDKKQIKAYNNQMKLLAEHLNFTDYDKHERITIIRVRGKPRMAVVFSTGLSFGRLYQDVIIVLDNGRYGHFYKEELYDGERLSSNAKLYGMLSSCLGDQEQEIKLATGKVKAIRYTECTPEFLEQQNRLYDEISNIQEFMKKRGYEEVVETDE